MHVSGIRSQSLTLVIDVRRYSTLADLLVTGSPADRPAVAAAFRRAVTTGRCLHLLGPTCGTPPIPSPWPALLVAVPARRRTGAPDAGRGDPARHRLTPLGEGRGDSPSRKRSERVDAGAAPGTSRAWTSPKAGQRGNQPVFVFGSLLNQRNFTEANFAIDALNHPDPGLELPARRWAFSRSIFDGLATSARGEGRAGGRRGRRRAARADAPATRRRRHAGLRAVWPRPRRRSRRRDSAVAAAEEDLEARAGTAGGGVRHAGGRPGRPGAPRRDEGAPQVAAPGQLEVARAQLNELIGAPLDTTWQLALDRGAADRSRGTPARARTRGARAPARR